MRREGQVALGVVAHLNGFAMIFLSRRHNGCTKLFPEFRRSLWIIPSNCHCQFRYAKPSGA